MRVIFFGTPEFAVPSLAELLERGFEVPLVVTQPDRPKGRGKQLAKSPVKLAAEARGIPVADPPSARDPELAARVRDLSPDALAVTAYGGILPAALLDIPSLGALNVHPSLLPAFRGPAPIQRAVLSDAETTGVTIMRLDQGMDTGDILLTREVPLLPDDTSGTLSTRLAVLGAWMLAEALVALSQGEITPVPQDHARATYAPALAKAEGRMDWTQSAARLERFVRGMDPWPGAFTSLSGKRLKIFSARVGDGGIGEPGQVLASEPGTLAVATGDGILFVEELQGASGKRLTAADFLRGSPTPPGTLLGREDES
ncbi:MAG: methionyl-tRNA formyltransferase [Proteobacteria bacterium]|nr:methionyl-tRNA formyltransferase [Pseudomonadota bacterium]